MPQIERVRDEAHEAEPADPQQAAAGGASGTLAVDQQGRAEHGIERVGAGKGTVLRQQADAAGDQGQPQQRQQTPQEWPPHRRERAQCQQGAEQQFPDPGGGDEEGRRRRALHHPDAQGERRHGQSSDDDHPGATPQPVQDHQQQRQADIELLLHRQRPGVQQRVEDRHLAEIVIVPDEQHVRDEQDRGHDGVDEFLVVVRQQDERCDDAAERQHDEEGRQYAPGTPLVEVDEAEAVAADATGHDRGDQVARDHEEDVDADKAATEARNAGMEEDHGQHGDGPQPVDLRPICQSVAHGSRSRQCYGRLHSAGGRFGNGQFAI